jgi:hypothetical protein
MSGESSPSDSDYSFLPRTEDNNDEEEIEFFNEEEPELDSELEEDVEDDPVSALQSLFDQAIETPSLSSLSQPGLMPSNPPSSSGPPPSSSSGNQPVSSSSGGTQQPASTGTQASQTQTTAASSSTMTSAQQRATFSVGTEIVEYDPTGGSVVGANEAYYKKTDRAPMAPDKLADLFDKATRTKLTVKFDLISSTFNESDKLDDNYNIGILVLRFKNHCIKYDMFDVMNIVFLDKNNSAQPVGATKDLTEHYSSISEVEVAQSCEWYRKYTVKNYYRENLQLITDFLENNCTENLWEKCVEAHDEYPIEQKGGPLMFSIMMRLLMSHSDNAVQYLINSVKNLQIRNFEGENVSKVVSLIRGAYKRLKIITKVPEEFPQWVLQVLQTSMVDSFNESFAHLQRNIEVVDTLLAGRTIPKYPPIENTLQVAQLRYMEMLGTGKWTGLTTKANQSSFVAQQGTEKKNVTCWNCGIEGHGLKQCTRALNQTMIEQRRKSFKETKDAKKNPSPGGKEKGKSGKWAAPTQEENNRRVINGKPMFYIKRTKRWENDKKALPRAPAANAASNQVPQAPTPPPVPTAPGSSDVNKFNK